MGGNVDEVALQSAGRGRGPPRPASGHLYLRTLFLFLSKLPPWGEVPDGHFPSKINSLGPVSVRIRGVIYFQILF